jgi:hypothetical protein
VSRLDEITARALGIRPGGALLVRPDGIAADSWPHDAGAHTVLARAMVEIASTGGDALDDADAA